MSGYASFDEKRIKHLEMIQSAIVRVSSAGIHTKCWSFVLTAALLALAVQQQECLLGAVSMVIAFGLWVLDHDFLRSEQLFRKLYEHARAAEEPEPFFMDATGEKFIGRLEKANLHHGVSRWNVFKSPPLWIVYGSQMFAGFIVWLVLRITVG